MENKAVYTMRVAVQLTGLNAQTIRKYEKDGLLNKIYREENLRYYTQSDIDKLLEIKKLWEIYGLNNQGIKLVLKLKESGIKVEKYLEEKD